MSTRDDAVDMLQNCILNRIPVRLAFVNANLANMAYEDVSLQSMLRNFVLLNDGTGVNLASRLLYGKSFPENLNGTDFAPYFLDHCQQPLSIFLLGARQCTVAKAAQVIAQRWPRHNVAGYHHGYFSLAEKDRVTELIRIAKPNLILVGMGNGLQESWCERLISDGFLSAWAVGGLFDFLADESLRAPLWMRRLGIEWVHCLILNPRRKWRRYVLGNPTFIMRILQRRSASQVSLK